MTLFISICPVLLFYLYLFLYFLCFFLYLSLYFSDCWCPSSLKLLTAGCKQQRLDCNESSSLFLQLKILISFKNLFHLDSCDEFSLQIRKKRKLTCNQYTCLFFIQIFVFLKYFFLSGIMKQMMLKNGGYDRDADEDDGYWTDDGYHGATYDEDEINTAWKKYELFWLVTFSPLPALLVRHMIMIIKIRVIIYHIIYIYIYIS